MIDADRIRILYEELDEKAVRFAEASSLSCPKGCGKCCADMEVSASEAEYIARFIKSTAPELEERVRSQARNTGRGCVFYNTGSDLHCRIYKARPLICRCFGYSAEEDRTGALVFPACQHMDLPAGLQSGGGAVRILFEPHPPVMQHYRLRIDGEPGHTSRMRPVGPAVLDALNDLNAH